MALALMAAGADGHNDDTERTEIARVAASVSGGTLNVAGLYQDVLLAKISLADAAAALTRPDAKQLAYELCVGVCSADGAQNDAERAFLDSLRKVLALSGPAAQSANATTALAEALAVAPVNTPLAAAPGSPSGALSADEQDKLILHYAILNGALEVLPDSLSTMAIVPLQMKMVYRIGQSFGVELDRAHIKEFAGTAGIGIASQFVEQIGVKLVGSVFGRGLLGGLLGGLAGQSVSSGFSFATTYALGRLAVRYYSGGRALSAQMLKDTYQGLLREAQGLQGNYVSAIQEKARTINVTELLQDVAR
jgi:uncharacterized protein (DUF697 family)